MKPQDSRPVQVLLVDDHDIVRAGLRAIFSRAGIEVVGEAGTVAEAIEAAAGTTGLTSGPVGPPADLKPAQFLQIIISYKEQAIQLGWIKNQGVGLRDPLIKCL